MTFPPRRTGLKNKVLALFDKNPNLTVNEIADKLGVLAAYVRKTLARNGRKAKPQRKRRQ